MSPVDAPIAARAFRLFVNVNVVNVSLESNGNIRRSSLVFSFFFLFFLREQVSSRVPRRSIHSVSRSIEFFHLKKKLANENFLFEH